MGVFDAVFDIQYVILYVCFRCFSVVISLNEHRYRFPEQFYQVIDCLEYNQS